MVFFFFGNCRFSGTEKDKCFGTVQRYRHVVLNMFQRPSGKKKVVIIFIFLFFIKAISGPRVGNT